MLINEAKWIGERINHLPIIKNGIVLNFGSQTLKYNKENKHVIDFVINPLKQVCLLKNLDLHKGPEIDYSGNILNDTFFNQLASIQFEGVLLCNVLEHVTNIKGIAQKVGKLIKPGGFLLFTGPYKYPVHYDPIDNGFRPKVQDVMSLFKEFNIIYAEIVTDYTYSYYLRKNNKQLFLTFVRVLTPFYKFRKWKNESPPKSRGDKFT